MKSTQYREEQAIAMMVFNASDTDLLLSEDSNDTNIDLNVESELIFSNGIGGNRLGRHYSRNVDYGIHLSDSFSQSHLIQSVNPSILFVKRSLGIYS